MKYRLLILVLFGCASKGVTQQEYFLRGNKAYKMSNHQQALDNYCMINDKGCCVWGNMGLSYKAQNKEQEALYCWYKALQQASGLKIAYQINNFLCEQEMDYSSVRTMRDKVWQRSLRPLVYGMPLGIVQWFFIITLVIIVLGSWYYRIRSWFLLMIVLSILLLLSGTLLLMRYYCATCKYAIIAAQAPLHVGPGITYYKSGESVHPALVSIIDTHDQWTHIANASEHNWVENRFLKSLDA